MEIKLVKLKLYELVLSLKDFMKKHNTKDDTIYRIELQKRYNYSI